MKAHGCREDESPTARLREAIDDYASERWVDGFGFDGGDPNDHGNDARAARARLDALIAEQEAESALALRLLRAVRAGWRISYGDRMDAPWSASRPLRALRSPRFAVARELASLLDGIDAIEREEGR